MDGIKASKMISANLLTNSLRWRRLETIEKLSRPTEPWPSERIPTPLHLYSLAVSIK
jgi:hypothetical protein